MRIKLGPFGSFCFATCLINGGAFLIETDWPASLRALQAQDKKYLFKEYADPDRMEGIVRKEQLVAGEKLLLISATIENSEPLPAADISSYNLKFYVKDTTQVSIEVWEYDNSYKMSPFLKAFPAGLAKFSWPSEIPLSLKITLKDLCPLAKTADAGPPTYLPIALYYTNAELLGQFYSFGFIPLKSITTLEYAFYSLSSINPVYSGRTKDIPRGRKVFIQWNGKDLNNKMTDSGLYTLVITATYTPQPGTRQKPPITTQYRFYHLSDLLEK